METTDLGNPINTTIVAQDPAFDWNAYDNIIVYLIGKQKTLKMSVVDKAGYLPLIIVSASTLKIEVEGKYAKTLGLGEVYLNVFYDNADVQKEIIKSTPFGIEYINNSIKYEVV